jgi:hypothetical protein
MSETSSPPRPCAIGPGVQPGAAPGSVGQSRDKFSVRRLLSFRALALPGAGFDSRRLHPFQRFRLFQAGPGAGPRARVRTPRDREDAPPPTEPRRTRPAPAHSTVAAVRRPRYPPGAPFGQNSCTCLNLPTRAPPLARSGPGGRTRGWPEHDVPSAGENDTLWSAFEFDGTPPLSGRSAADTCLCDDTHPTRVADPDPVWHPCALRSAEGPAETRAGVRRQPVACRGA